MLILIALILTIINVNVINSYYLQKSELVTIGNYTFEVENGGSFYLYEKHPNKVVLKQYPAIYFVNCTDDNWPYCIETKDCFAVGTKITNFNEEVVGYVVGQYDGYYPIVPRKNSTMWCGRYGLENLIKHDSDDEQVIYFKGLEFTLYDFRNNFNFLASQDYQCFIYA